MSRKFTSFSKPNEEHYKPWEIDRSDVDSTNNTSFIYNRNISLSLNEQKERLPIFKYKSHLLYLLEHHQIVILVGDTGCGKSTQIPQYLLEAGWCENNLLVGISEPRRFCATTLAQRVSEELQCKLGSTVGYTIRFDDCTDPKSTKIKYLTEGILIREIMADPLLRKYSVIILDEVHERNMSTDIVMGLMKKILKKRKRLKLIVMSATIDATSLKHFFNRGDKFGKNEEDNATILSVEGKTHSILMHYVNESLPDYVIGAVNCAKLIHVNESEGDILVFLTGSEEVDRAVELLKEQLTDKCNKYWTPLILPMYGALPYSEQLKVFRPSPRGMRKIIIATNIAETSITLGGIVYVVDSGFVKMRWFDPKTYTDSLVVVPISKASAIQRAGRAGRVKPGKVYRLYTEEEYDKLSTCTPPEIIRSDLSSGLLQLKALGIDNILRFTFPTPPPAENLLLAFELLNAIGAIDDGGHLTESVGSKIAEFPLPPLHSKTLISSVEFGCVDEITTILAMLQVDNIFVKPYSGSNAIKARIAKRKFEVEEGDLITMLNVYTAFKKVDKAKSWCGLHFISYKALKRVDEIKSQMLRLLNKFGIENSSCNGNVENICRCITSGFFPNAAYLHYTGVYKLVRGGVELFIHPTSVLYTLEQPQWIIYCELIHSNKHYMRDLMVINPKWLLELAPNFYHMAPNV